jgi:replication initiation and membrane attachment protein DnaB
MRVSFHPNKTFIIKYKDNYKITISDMFRLLYKSILRLQLKRLIVFHKTPFELQP